MDRVVITVALAGMFTPAAKVSVAKTTCEKKKEDRNNQTNNNENHTAANT